MGWLVRGGLAYVNLFSTINPNLKYFFGRGGGGGGGGGRVQGARASEFFTENPNLKKNVFLWVGDGGGGRVG